VKTVTSERLILFTRYPTPGRAKTRLIPVLGEQGAAALQRRLTLRAIRLAERVKAIRCAQFEIHYDGADAPVMQGWLGDRFEFYLQRQGDLGQRMVSAFEESFREGSDATVLIGADCPELTVEIVGEAFSALREAPVVFGPALDGGYYLVGLRRPVQDLFRGPSWGSDTVLADSLLILKKAGLEAALLKPLPDIDRPEDLQIWSRIVGAEEADLSKISVIIPALNEATRIARTIESALMGNPLETIVVDAGSRDETMSRAREAGATVLSSGHGRGRQMNAGASRATGSVLLFLHADTLLPGNYSSLTGPCLSDPKVSAGAFRFTTAERFAGRSVVQWTTNLRSRWLQMPYGDQALFLRRALFEELGGFVDWPLLEDYELVRRLRRRGKVKTLSEPAVTSGRRWQRLGALRTTWINMRVIIGYRLGVPIEKLATLYCGGGKGKPQ
jgi:rSAM/selenodomain-associated transferase 2/rSAM/selenodomain-associated transferase 1